MATLIMDKAQCLELFQSLTSPIQGTPSGIPISNSNRWSPPRPNFTKVNSDATFDITTSKGCASVVCRDERGRVLTCTIYVLVWYSRKERGSSDV